MNLAGLLTTAVFALLSLLLGITTTRSALRNLRGMRLLGVRGIRTDAVVARGPRREGQETHPPQVRWQIPTGQTFRRVPLNVTHYDDLRKNLPVVLRYDPAEPSRAVIERTSKTYTARSMLVWGISQYVLALGLTALGFTAL